jgi:hypothetical protein
MKRAENNQSHQSNQNTSKVSGAQLSNAGGPSISNSDIVFQEQISLQNIVPEHVAQHQRDNSRQAKYYMALESPMHPATTGGNNTNNSNLNRKNSRKLNDAKI